MRSRLQTAMRVKQQASRFVISSALRRHQVTPTGSSQAQTETETETESECPLVEQTSHIVAVATAGAHEGEKIDDRFISCRCKQIRCHVTQVKSHF